VGRGFKQIKIYVKQGRNGGTGEKERNMRERYIKVLLYITRGRHLPSTESSNF